jgi:hypothetical protein
MHVSILMHIASQRFISLILMSALSHPCLHSTLPGAALLYPNGVSALTVWLVNFDLQTLQASPGEKLGSLILLLMTNLQAFRPKLRTAVPAWHAACSQEM